MITGFRNNYARCDLNSTKLIIEIDPPKLPLRTIYEETKDQINYVYENNTKPVYVCLSGGVDSEFLVHVMHDMKLDFTVVIVRFLGHNNVIYNDYDIEHAFTICKKLSLKPLVYDFNFDEYVESGELLNDKIKNNANTYCFDPDSNMFVRVAKELGGFFLMAGGAHGVEFDEHTKLWYFRIQRSAFFWVKNFEQNQISGSPYFLTLSSEMFFSFLLDPDVIKLVSGGFPKDYVISSVKSFIYNKGNNFELKQYNTLENKRIKFTGWEKILNSPISDHPLYTEYTASALKKMNIDFDPKFLKFTPRFNPSSEPKIQDSYATVFKTFLKKYNFNI